MMNNARIRLLTRAIRSWSFHALLLCLFIVNVESCFGEWTKTIDCAAPRVYRDLRKDAGREEFCELVLPGSLVVKDGPYRFWFSEGHPGPEGSYDRGREVGPWKECDRFDRCTQRLNEAVFPQEKARATFKPEIPVSYAHSKYTFDFASCRSTWITQTVTPDPINLNIGGGWPYRCEIAYIPQSSMDQGGDGGYFCRVPFAVGIREFDSLDLRRELPLAGLPQFCHPIYLHGEPLIVQDSKGFPVATTVDVEYADIKDAKAGHAVLTLKLNKYAEGLVKQAAGQPGGMITLLCFRKITGPKTITDADGKVRFTYLLPTYQPELTKLESCAAKAFPAEPDH
jgi:hypothetical protein